MQRIFIKGYKLKNTAKFSSTKNHLAAGPRSLFFEVFDLILWNRLWIFGFTVVESADLRCPIQVYSPMKGRIFLGNKDFYALIIVFDMKISCYV